jgi:hypothetical protein
MKRRLDRVATVAPYLVLGPVSGFLVQMIRRRLRDGRPVLASMYGILLVQFTLLLGYVAEKVVIPG